jgi:hypothetical protein
MERCCSLARPDFVGILAPELRIFDAGFLSGM